MSAPPNARFGRAESRRRRRWLSPAPSSVSARFRARAQRLDSKAGTWSKAQVTAPVYKKSRFRR